ncbi:MAG: globin family protein [Bacteroidota bacterium]
MKTNSINLVRSSWAIVATMDPVIVGEIFYYELFEIMPEVKPMFSRSTMPEQSRKLLSMLSYIISKLDKLEDIMGEVKKLAQRHVQYGVKAAHYDAVGEALIRTLAKGLGDQWNEPLKAAWIEVYTLLSGAMMDADEQNNVMAA